MTDDTDSALQQVTKGASLVLIGTFVQLGLSFVAKLVMARFLEVDQYGLVTLGIISINILATVSLFGLDTGLARYLPRYERSDVARSAIYFSYGISLIVSLTLAILLFVFAGPISRVLFSEPSIKPVLRLMIVGIPAWTILDLGIGITRGRSETLPRVYTQNILLPLGRFFLVSVVIIFGFAELGVASAYVGAYVFASIAVTYMIFKRFPPALPSVGGHQRELFAFSLPLMFSGISSFIYGNIDLFLLGFFIDPTAVAIYNVVYPLASLLRVGTGAFGFLFVPTVSSLHANGKMDDAKRVYQVTTKWLLIVISPLFAIMTLFPDMVITVLFGSKYDDGVLTLIVLAFGFFLVNLTGMNSSVLSSIGRSKSIMIADVSAMVLNVTLNLILIPQYGYFGAGVATTLAYLSRDAIHGVVLYLVTGFHPFTSSLVRPTVFTAVAVGIIYFPATLFLQVTILRLVGLFILFLIIYVVSILRFGGVDREDVMMLNTIEGSIGVNISWFKRLLQRVMSE